MSLTRPLVSYTNLVFFLSLWDIVSTELLWTLSLQVSKNTTTEKKKARAATKTNKKEKNEKGKNFWYIPLWLIILLVIICTPTLCVTCPRLALFSVCQKK